MPQLICPVCQTPREGELRDRLSFKIHFQMIFASFTLAAVVYLFTGFEIALRCLAIYLPMLAVAEFIHGVKMRHATKCIVCHFDPILYIKDWRLARKNVEEKLTSMSQEIAAEIRQRSQKISAERTGQALSNSAPVEIKNDTQVTQ